MKISPLFKSAVVSAALGAAAMAAQAQVANGSLWKVSEAVSQSATLANVPASLADVTFSVTSPFNFSSSSGYTIQNFLDSSSSFNIHENTAGTLSSVMDNGTFGTLMYFTGTVTVTNGMTFTIAHDDGVTLIIDGVNVGANPGPTAAVTDTYTWNGASGNLGFQLVYGECCGAPAVLRASLPFTAAVPEPETYALLLGGLGLVGVMARRRKG